MKEHKWKETLVVGSDQGLGTVWTRGGRLRWSRHGRPVGGGTTRPGLAYGSHPLT